MSALKKTISLGLVALSVAGALTVTAPAAEARDRHRDVWPGVAAGLAGGIIGGAIVAGSQRPAYAEPEYVEPEYDYAPRPRRPFITAAPITATTRRSASSNGAATAMAKPIASKSARADPQG